MVEIFVCVYFLKPVSKQIENDARHFVSKYEERNYLHNNVNLLVCLSI